MWQTLIGVVVGACLAGGVQMLTGWHTRIWVHRQWLHEQRAKAYPDYLNAFFDVLDTAGQALTTGQRQALYTKAFRAMTRAELVASDPVIDSLRARLVDLDGWLASGLLNQGPSPQADRIVPLMRAELSEPPRAFRATPKSNVAKPASNVEPRR